MISEVRQMEASIHQQHKNIQNTESNLILIASGLFTFKFERLHTCNISQTLEETNSFTRNPQLSCNCLRNGNK